MPYKDRFQLLHMTVDTKATSFPDVSTVLVATRFLRDEWRRNFVGDAYAFDTSHPFNTLRFDPEAVAVSPFGNFFVSDEYGPYVREFGRNGQLIGAFRCRRNSVSIRRADTRAVTSTAAATRSNCSRRST